VPRFLVFVVALLSSACASPLSSAVGDFEAGRTTAALRELKALGRRGLPSDPGTRARYALYRGLAHLTLGDAGAAESFLLGLKRSVERDRELLSTSERCRLVTALAALGHLPGDSVSSSR
jgi:hypothetical protein